MPFYRCYVPRKFAPKTMLLIDKANEIIAEYSASGFDLTLRQLYYQFVSRDLLPNKQQSYDNLGSIINDARLAGLVDWNIIEDRTRNVEQNPHWSTPQSIIESCVNSFGIDKWFFQPERVEVWIEKDALRGVIDGICSELDVPHFSCRGYTSQSEMWRAARRFERHLAGQQKVTVIHLGDHDPSGIDMTRDIRDRIRVFLAGDGFDPDEFTIERIALNYGQVEQYQPPPNPAKLSDSRAASYIDEYGHESWELDALEPQVLVDLIREKVTAHRDDNLWDEAVERERGHIESLQRVAENWDNIVEGLNEQE